MNNLRVKILTKLTNGSQITEILSQKNKSFKQCLIPKVWDQNLKLCKIFDNITI